MGYCAAGIDWRVMGPTGRGGSNPAGGSAACAGGSIRPVWGPRSGIAHKAARDRSSPTAFWPWVPGPSSAAMGRMLALFLALGQVPGLALGQVPRLALVQVPGLAMVLGLGLIATRTNRTS